MTAPSRPEHVTIVGAGPSGLACAIALARAGVRVTVREARATVGARFHGDFEGLENWSSETDVLDELAAFGIQATFDHVPVRDGVAFDHLARRYEVHSGIPLFYLVRRGNHAGTLDRALYQQALDAGVVVRFDDKVEALDSGTPGVIAAGPRLPSAIAAGFAFETTMPDRYYIRFDESLTPGGYGYLLVHAGLGTVAICIARDFHNEATHLERTVMAFKRDTGLVMREPRRFGGTGSFFLRRSPYQGAHPVVGEHAGLQDALLGFGMRLAMRSGAWAACNLLGEGNLLSRWDREMRPLLRASVVSRFIFDCVGDSGHSRLLRTIERSADPRSVLRRIYVGGPETHVLFPLASVLNWKRLNDRSCNHADCTCVWCREMAGRGGAGITAQLCGTTPAYSAANQDPRVTGPAI